MPGPGTDKILGPTVVGMLDGGDKLTPGARNAFTTQVVTLLLKGNEDGKGCLISSLFGLPLPPVPGPPFFDADKALLTPSDPLAPCFWFKASPLALPTIPFLQDPNGDYQKIIVDNLYAPLVKLLNLPGNLSLTPIFDPTIFFPGLPTVKIPDFLKALTPFPPPPPELPKIVAKFNIDLDGLKLIVALPIPPKLPPLGLTLPPIPSVNFDFITFPDLFLKLMTLPIVALPKIFVKLLDPAILIPPDLGKIFGIILEVIFPSLLEILGLIILPKLLIATMTIIIQNLVMMLVVDIIGMILGAGGLCKLAAGVFGLVA